MANYKPFLSDKEVDQILLDDSSVSSLEIESDSVESEIDYAQEEFVTVNEQEHDAEQETDVTADDKDVQWMWRELYALRNNVKIPFTGQSGAQKDFVSVSDTFLLFFDEEVIVVIVAETNKYVEQYTQKCTLNETKVACQEVGASNRRGDLCYSRSHDVDGYSTEAQYKKLLF
jgi:hypothetical protein